MTPRAPAAAEPRRLTPSERAHEALIAAISRPQRTSVQSVEVGETAAKVPYVKSLQVHQLDGEGWKPWMDRTAEMLAYLRKQLPDAQNGSGASEKPAKATRRPRGMSDKVPF